MLRQLAIVQVLVDAHADVNARNDSGDTPLGFAVDPLETPGRPGNPKDPAALRKLVTVLGKAGADMNRRNGFGYAPLQLALRGYDAQLVTTLLDLGAKADAIDDDGNGALHWLLDSHSHITDADRVELVKVLAQHGAKKGTKNKAGKRAVDLAPAGSDLAKALAP
jgi:ankyrin repeat protein